jgi:hypothetical protein
MGIRMRGIWVALMATLILATGYSTASALRSLSISGSTTTVLNGILTFETGGGLEVICNYTITKTISRVIPKVDGILMGKWTRVNPAAPGPDCRSSSGRLEGVRVLNLEREEECRMYFKGILGSLPRIIAYQFFVQNCKIAYEVEVFAIRQTCLYTPEAPLPMSVSVNASGVIGSLVIGENRWRRISGGGFCPATGRMKGTLVPLQTTTLFLI